MFTVKEKHRNAIGIIIDKKVKENVVHIKRLGDEIIRIELVLEKETQILKCIRIPSRI